MHPYNTIFGSTQWLPEKSPFNPIICFSQTLLLTKLHSSLAIFHLKYSSMFNLFHLLIHLIAFTTLNLRSQTEICFSAIFGQTPSLLPFRIRRLSKMTKNSPFWNLIFNCLWLSKSTHTYFSPNYDDIGGAKNTISSTQNNIFWPFKMHKHL